MNWDAIGAVGEIAGAIAVVVSIIYLSTQIRASIRQSKNAETLRFQEQFVQLNRLTLSNTEHAELVYKVLIGETLTPNEEVRAHAWASMLINVWGGADSAFHYGQISEPYYRNVMCTDVERTVRENPGLVKYLKSQVESAPHFAKVEIYAPIFEAIANYKQKNT